MKTSTPLPAPHVAPFVATALAQVEGALSIGEARLMVGHRDPHDGVRAEVPRGLPLRCRHRLRSLLEDYAPTIPTGPTINTHSPGEAGPRSRTLPQLPQGRREVDPATDRDDPYEDEAYRLWAIKQQSKCPRGPRHFRLRRIRLLLSRLAFAATFLRYCSTILFPDAPAIRLVPAFAAAKTFSLTMRWASR
ncbi:hypothetical protein AB7M74_009807 [Bradyrhizobium japonicum]